MFWQLTIDANDAAVLARFWAQALGYQPVPPPEPPIWFQQVPGAKAGKNRLHLDL